MEHGTCILIIATTSHTKPNVAHRSPPIAHTFDDVSSIGYRESTNGNPSTLKIKWMKRTIRSHGAIHENVKTDNCSLFHVHHEIDTDTSNAESMSDDALSLGEE
eukprot:253295_1